MCTFQNLLFLSHLQMFEMCLLNYHLVVLDGAFLVHTPGIKQKARKINAVTQEFFRPHERKNAKIYQRVIKRLIKQYPINRRCAHWDIQNSGAIFPEKERTR